MYRRVLIVLLSGLLLLLSLGCTNKKVQNPIANVNSKQPDKVLFDRATDAMKHGKYDVARLSLQTLINTYPDSEYIARAKLAIGDSWYAEGGSAAWAQAESEYKDFITFFPNMPEAAEAQLKIANIHYKEMEKADRDFTHAKRAEDEYRQLIQQFPDSKLVPEAKQRLLEVQEVLARREYMIAHFYFMRESYPAAIARYKSVIDTYPLFSNTDEALFELGTSYEREADAIRKSKLPETIKGTFIKQYTGEAVSAYDKMLTRYPLEDRTADAKKRLQAMKQPIPQATPAAIAEDKAEIASRGEMGHVSKVMENFKHGPDVSEATKVGEPTLVDPKQASAPEMVRAANASIVESLSGSKNVAVERIIDGSTPPVSQAVPRSDNPPASGEATAAPVVGEPTNAPTPDSGNPAGSEMKNDLPPAAGNEQAPMPPPTQVNDAPAANNAADAQTSLSANGSATATGDAASKAPPANTSTESSSKKKKKRHLIPF
jgi:outer membrane protein assembly factor BamD